MPAPLFPSILDDWSCFTPPLTPHTDSKNEYLQPASTGLYDTFAAAETLFTKVKQTSDATLDSRLLVAATDLVLKKATNLVYGNAGIGIDADEFVGKCIAFMRNNPENRHGLPGEAADEDGPIDDAMDWAYFGREAAFKGNKRPATTDFLLGPLSVTKKVRVFKTRRAGLKRDNANLVRPVEVIQDGNGKEQENAGTMIALVKGIYDLLKDLVRKNPRYEEVGIGLFRFVVNPHSFGQTVENIFYLSFLVKDGFVAFMENDDGLPVLCMFFPSPAVINSPLYKNANIPGGVSSLYRTSLARRPQKTPGRAQPSHFSNDDVGMAGDEEDI